MTFSLIAATINRVQAVGALLASIEQTPEAAAGQVQVIVVDQNRDDRLVEVLEPYRRSLNLIHQRSLPGLSRARNAGLAVTTGEVVSFPDDDCLYRPTTLTETAAFLARYSECDGVCGRVCDFDGRPYNLRWPREAEPVSKRRVWRQAISVSMFLRRTVIESVGRFDESLGVGAGTPWGSGEETDYVLRALALGFQLRFEPAIGVLHPASPNRFAAAERARAHSYALGMGRVLRIHAFPFRDRAKFVLMPALGSLLFATRGSLPGFRYYASVAKGRLLGVLSQ